MKYLHFCLNVMLLMVLCLIKIIDAQKNDPQFRSPEKCKISSDLGGKYKFLFSNRNSTFDKTLFIFVVIKPENIDRTYLLSFVDRIRKENCNEKRIVVEIFDDKKYAGNFAVSENLIKKNVVAGYRGEYSFNNDSGLERLTYSTKRGNSISEIIINFTKGIPVDVR